MGVPWEEKESLNGTDTGRTCEFTELSRCVALRQYQRELTLFCTKFELSKTIWAIPMYLHRQMLHIPVDLNPKELVGDMSIAVLMATFPQTTS